jgi:MoxR-like ATPase
MGESTMSAVAIDRQVVDFQQRISRVREEIAKVIVGNDEVVLLTLACLLARGHVLLEGIPGVGKTRLVQTLADVLHLKFARIQFTPDLMPSDIVGTHILREGGDGRKVLEFQPGPVFANIVLADEINRATPKTQSALLEAMQENSVSVGQTTHALDQPFFVLATQNPLELEGTYSLPEAQLDRFLFKLRMDFPSAGELHQIIDRTTQVRAPDVTRVLDRAQILTLRDTVRAVPVALPIQDYAIRLTLGTHPEHPTAPAQVKRYVRFGASPRGAQALILGAKVHALMRDRVYVAGEDLRAVLLPALRHRLLLNFDAEADRVTSDAILRQVLEQVPVDAG